MVGDLRIPVPAPVGPKPSEHLEVILRHLIPLILPPH
jgi:hypothetical protein